jgi:molecular chaperone GrpE
MMAGPNPPPSPAGDASAESEWATLQQDVVSLIRRVSALKADLAEVRRQARKDQERLLLALVELLDDFERVFANIEPREATADRQARIWVGNFRSVRRRLELQLKSHGVARIEAPGGRAMPGFHTVVDTRENLDADDGTIIEESKKGYLWLGEVLRKAEVVVVKN